MHKIQLLTFIRERGLLETVILALWYSWIKIKSSLLILQYSLRSYDLHQSVMFYGKHEFRRTSKGSIKIGKSCGVGNNVVMRCFGKGKIQIGHNVSINEYTIMHAGDQIKIGNNVTFGAFCYVNDTNHKFDKTDVPINQQGWDAKGITIEDDVWIGVNVTILDGVTIGKGSVIGAGAVVTKSIQPYTIAVGVPAKKIRSRGILSK